MAKKKKIYNINAEDLIEQGLNEFLKEFKTQLPDLLKDSFESEITQSLIKLCYSAGFQDGSVAIGGQIAAIIKGEIDGPEVNMN